MTDPVRDQYEAYPYPARDPADEAGRLIVGSPSHLLEVNHYVFGGRRDFSKPFRALIAGGGTGDAAIMLAQQLADAGGAGEVVHLDLSLGSQAIAKARAEARGLRNLSFHRLAIEDLPGAALGRFDYIDCCGVLHHLEDPARGLAALVSVLDVGGGLGVMLYGSLGRTGVYSLRDLLAAITPDDPAPQRIRLARKLLGQLPETNWFRRNPAPSDHLEGGDAGLVDLLLHARDRAYGVREIVALSAGAGLFVTAFVEPARYDPETYLTDPELVGRIQDLDRTGRWAWAENLAGNLATHVFYLVPEARADEAVARPGPTAIPHLFELDGPAFAKDFKPGGAMTATLDGLQFRFPLPALTGAMLARMDGRRTLSDIHAELRETNPDLEWTAFAEQFDALYRAMNGLGKLFLSFPG
jgi:SAM-dependent methyltransferase